MSHEFLILFGIDLLRGSTIILCVGFEQNYNRWLNINFPWDHLHILCALPECRRQGWVHNLCNV